MCVFTLGDPPDLQSVPASPVFVEPGKTQRNKAFCFLMNLRKCTKRAKLGLCSLTVLWETKSLADSGDLQAQDP